MNGLRKCGVSILRIMIHPQKEMKLRYYNTGNVPSEKANHKRPTFHDSTYVEGPEKANIEQQKVDQWLSKSGSGIIVGGEKLEMAIK